MTERQTITALQKCWEFNRGRTLRTLGQIEELPNTEDALSWRPAPGHAHLAWQLMHIGITEELFATSRILGTEPDFADLVSRFKGGSTPDDDIPSAAEIRNVLNVSRHHLLTTFEQFTDSDLDTIPEAFTERGWSLGKLLEVIAWHEAHHEGQTHAVWNLFLESRDES
jgi:uncharacterized damage-inducible protein DinB